MSGALQSTWCLVLRSSQLLTLLRLVLSLLDLLAKFFVNDDV